MFDNALGNLQRARGSDNSRQYLQLVIAAVGAIGRLPNGQLRGHVDRQDLSAAVTAVLTELTERVRHLDAVAPKPQATIPALPESKGLPLPTAEAVTPSQKAT